MEEAPENGKDSPHSAHANGMNAWNISFRWVQQALQQQPIVGQMWSSHEKSNEMLSGNQLYEY